MRSTRWGKDAPQAHLAAANPLRLPDHLGDTESESDGRLGGEL